MRIAIVAPFGLRAKGTTRGRALPLARALAGRGHVVALFIPPYDSPEDSGRRWTETFFNYTRGRPPSDCRPPTTDRVPPANGSPSGRVEVVNVLLPAWRQGSVSWHAWLAWRLLCAVCRWRPDVVHVCKPKGPSGLVGGALWLMRRLRLSPGHLVLDADDWEGPGGWNDDPRTGYSRLQRRFFAWQERYGLSHADAWTVTSECLRQRAIAFGAAAEKVFILPNGIWDLGKNHFGIRNLDFGKNHFGIRISDFGIRVVGSQNPPFAIRNSKWGCLPFALLYTRFAGVRVPDVVAIWQRVREMAPEARLVVVGQGLGGEEAELGRLPGVELAGWAEPEELPVLLDKVAVAVIPWADTPANRARSSVKVRELMAAGLPIVAYAVGELPALLGDTGVLVPAGDDLAFAQAVVALLADPERARELAAAARARIMAHFTWDRLVEVALAAYGA